MDILDEICEYVNKEFNLDIKDVTRKRDYVEARALFYLIARKKTNYSYECISGYLNKNHATAVHAVQNIVRHLSKDTVIKALAHFDLMDDIPEDNPIHYKYKLEEAEEELKHKREMVNIIPKLEDVYSRLKYLSEEQKEIARRTTKLQFETIDRCLDRVMVTLGLVV